VPPPAQYLFIGFNCYYALHAGVHVSLLKTNFLCRVSAKMQKKPDHGRNWTGTGCSIWPFNQ
jgi:hypothetical protein